MQARASVLSLHPSKGKARFIQVAIHQLVLVFAWGKMAKVPFTACQLNVQYSPKASFS